MCRVLILSYDTAIFYTDGEGVRSVVYVAMLFYVCVTQLIFREDKIIVVVDDRCCGCV